MTQLRKVMHGLAPCVKTLVVQVKMASAVGMVPVTEKLLHVPAFLGGEVMTVIPQFALDSLSAQAMVSVQLVESVFVRHHMPAQHARLNV